MAMITQDEVEERIGGFDLDTQRGMVCAIVGHSRLLTRNLGQACCARCGAVLGDMTAGPSADPHNLEKIALIGCNCKACAENFNTYGWKDMLRVPKYWRDFAKKHFKNRRGV